MTNLKFIPDGCYIEIVDVAMEVSIGEIWLGSPVECMMYTDFTLVAEELLEIAEYMKGLGKE